jgi:putative hemolysin
LQHRFENDRAWAGNIRALKLLELFKQSRTHIAVVIDEYGSIQGLITLNDILEAIVGDLPSSDNRTNRRSSSAKTARG